MTMDPGKGEGGLHPANTLTWSVPARARPSLATNKHHHNR